MDTSLRLHFEQVRVQVGDTINILPNALLAMAKLGNLVKYRHFYTLKKAFMSPEKSVGEWPVWAAQRR